MTELMQTAMSIALNQYGNRGSTAARQLHAAVLLRRAADELTRLVHEQLDDDKLRAAIDDAVSAYPTRDEISKAVGL